MGLSRSVMPNDGGMWLTVGYFAMVNEWFTMRSSPFANWVIYGII